MLILPIHWVYSRIDAVRFKTIYSFYINRLWNIVYYVDHIYLQLWCRYFKLWLLARDMRRTPFHNSLWHAVTTKITCPKCNEINTITDFLIDCKRNEYFWKGWSRWWHSITGFFVRKIIYMNLYYLGSLEIVITPLLQTASCMLNNTSI